MKSHTESPNRRTGSRRFPLLGQIAAAFVSATLTWSATAGEAPTAIFQENFDDGLADAFSTPTGLWHVTENHPASGGFSLGYVTGETPGAEPNGNFDVGATSGSIFSPGIALPVGNTVLSFNAFRDTETEDDGDGDDYDVFSVGISLDGGATIERIISSSQNSSQGGYYVPNARDISSIAYTPFTLSLSEYGGQTITLVFKFDSGDGAFNNRPGIRVDDLLVQSGEANHLPTANDDSFVHVNLTAPTTLDVLSNDVDLDGDALVITSAHANNGSVAIAVGGLSLTYTPDGSGIADTISYVIQQPDGGYAVGSATVAFNESPVANPDTASNVSLTGTTIDVLANDTDPENDTLTITGATAQSGTVSVSPDGLSLNYIPDGSSISDIVSYTISDGFGGSAEGQVEISVNLQPVLEVLYSGATGGTTPAVGTAVPGETGVTFKTVGVPDIGAHGQTAFVTTLATSAGNKAAIFDGTAIVARKGDALASGALFTSFKDPVIDDEGEVTFLAGISGTGVTSSSNQVLMTNNGTSGTLTEIIRKGASAPGAAGSQITSFKAVLSTNTSVFFLAALANKTAGASPGPGGVTSADDLVLCSWNSTDGVLPVLREGATVGGKVVKSFSALLPASGSPGHGRAPLDSNDTVAARLVFDDGTQQLALVSSDAITPIANQSQAVGTDIPDAQFKKLGLPGLLGESTVFQAGLSLITNPADATSVSSYNNVGLFVADDLGFHLVARKGAYIDAGNTLKLSSFKDPIASSEGVASLASLSGAGLTGANNKGIIFSHDGNPASLVARLGAEPNGVPEGQWKAFKSVALPESLGPLFVGTLVTGANNAAGPGGVSKLNDVGVWASGHFGSPYLILREGQTITVNSVQKTVKSFKSLTSVGGSAGQTRSFNDHRQVTALVSFTDGSKAVVRVTLPGGSPLPPAI